ncbi:MAG: NAD-binding protein [Steroidobacteraceae bacterium]
MHPVSIVGCGYTGLRLARRWLDLGHPVFGYAKRADSLREIANSGATARPLDLEQPICTADMTDHLVYYAVPPAPAGTRDDRLERLLGHVADRPRRMIYLSTTGVYGDRGGAPVDEDTSPAPASPRAIRRLAAENALRDWAGHRGVSWCILRVPGIYGPGRLPLDRLRRGDPAIDPLEAGPGNRIHVEDLVTACVASALHPAADGRIYNVTDGTADSMTEFLCRVARIAGLPPPPFVPLAEAQRVFSALSWSFLSESRRVQNGRLRHELGVTPAFHDLDAGIRASL